LAVAAVCRETADDDTIENLKTYYPPPEDLTGGPGTFVTDRQATSLGASALARRRVRFGSSGFGFFAIRPVTIEPTTLAPMVSAATFMLLFVL
jgi:hypothetical protein